MTTCKKTRIFSVDEVARKVLTVETFDKEKGKYCRWVNNSDGTFRLIAPDLKQPIIKPVSDIYKQIKIAVHDQRIIAKRYHPNGSLFAVNVKLY
ncbi:hypothetical protein [Vagococcus xieshaowenii]|uniref:Uncharacterized protein n=1 Tax=Vagococcus xieshaowenii TaxID=2562451 RepID=A0AAJ5JLL3_9ENTE|nr:hypothetical protein [Vagococcus xieshaowenii]QCA29667.1 hypothetical protein E4Z98_09785 [Vagococcus xieshaowenii]TFZ42942.1 hypothetical protein E4031_01525 [Vagococcus xieshaowenii]